MTSFRLPIAAAALFLCGPCLGYDINDKLSVGGILALAGQCQELSDADADDKCKRSLPFQPEVSFRPTTADEVYVKMGFADANGLNRNEILEKLCFIVEQSHIALSRSVLGGLL